MKWHPLHQIWPQPTRTKEVIALHSCDRFELSHFGYKCQGLELEILKDFLPKNCDFEGFPF